MKRLIVFIVLVLIAGYEIAAQEGTLVKLQDFLNGVTISQFDYVKGRMIGESLYLHGKISNIVDIWRVYENRSDKKGISMVYTLFDSDGWDGGKRALFIEFAIPTVIALTIGLGDSIDFEGTIGDMFRHNFGFFVYTDENQIIHIQMSVNKVIHNEVEYLRNNDDVFTLDWSVVE